MPTTLPKQFVVLAVLAVTFVNPALLAQVARPAPGSRTSEAFARRAFRRSRRTWLLAHAARTQLDRQKAAAADGPSGSLVLDAGPAMPASPFAALAPSAESETLSWNSTPGRDVAVPRYLLYRTLLI